MLAVFVVAGCSQTNTPGPKKANVAQNPAQAATRVPADEPVAQVASQIGPSVVQVNVRGVQQTAMGPQNAEGIGSGVIYREDGYIITNNHVVEGARQVNVAFADGSEAQGQVVGTDSYTDIAVVKVDRNNLPAAKFSNSHSLLVGQLAVAIGSPSGFQSTVTSGVISGLNRELGPQQSGGGQQSQSLVDLIQTDAPISPGNSGGALVDREGEVVGINVAYLPQTQSGQPVEGIGFAIPAYTATSVADQIIQSGQASHPYLGIRQGDLTPEIAKQFNIPVKSGAIIGSVGQGTPASQAGLQAKDVITGFGGKKIEDSGDLLTALRQYQPGDTIKVTVSRNGKEQTFEVKLGTLPQQG